MRKLIYAINITLDGCCDHTKMIADEEVHDYHTQLLKEADTLVYGRITYQLMVPFWPDLAKSKSGPKAWIDFAQAFDSMSKIVVFSRSLEKAEGKAKIVRTNLQDEITQLKHQPGKNILVGGVDIPSQLIRLGLVDEYHLVVNPTFAGEGKRLMEGVSLPENLQLKFMGSKIFASGCVALRYEKN